MNEPRGVIELKKTRIFIHKFNDLLLKWILGF